MHLLQSGVPFNVIALWLGHESTTTTHRYVEADLAMKEKALARLEVPDTKLRRYRAPDSLILSDDIVCLKHRISDRPPPRVLTSLRSQVCRSRR